MNNTIDWTGQLEAYHEDGRVCPAERVNGGFTWTDGLRHRWHPTVEAGGALDFPGWRIRNVPQPTPQADTRPDLTAEQRAVELARSMALSNGAQSVALEHFFREARAIVALLPEPVDPDMIEAREMEAERAEANGFHDYAAKVRAGGEDNGPVRHRYEGIKRGRALALAGEKEA